MVKSVGQSKEEEFLFEALCETQLTPASYLGVQEALGRAHVGEAVPAAAGGLLPTRGAAQAQEDAAGQEEVAESRQGRTEDQSRLRAEHQSDQQVSCTSSRLSARAFYSSSARIRSDALKTC